MDLEIGYIRQQDNREESREAFQDPQTSIQDPQTSTRGPHITSIQDPHYNIIHFRELFELNDDARSFVIKMYVLLYVSFYITGFVCVIALIINSFYNFFDDVGFINNNSYIVIEVYCAIYWMLCVVFFCFGMVSICNHLFGCFQN